ncbi:MAG: RAD55 family ATPase [Thaumarchaeota archaeon]|nr:RAD55 family ATPase [Nitrososphaerota archaeon]MCL5317525.1 RAD55 family ATPase [Nitrososphaerota archaeon]
MPNETKQDSSHAGPMLFTGLETLDRMLGGIPEGSVVVLSGKPGSGFDIFAQQVLYSRVTTDGVKALYFTIEHPPEDVAAEMFSRNWNVEQLMEKKKWEFFDASTIRSNIRKGVASPKVLLSALDVYHKKLERNVWSAMDTFSYYLMHYDLQEVMGYVDDIVSKAREVGGLHLLLTVEGMLDTQTITSLAYLTDGLWTFTLESERAEPVGTIRIEKLRRADYVPRIISYRIFDEGLSIETSTRIS